MIIVINKLLVVSLTNYSLQINVTNRFEKGIESPNGLLMDRPVNMQ